MIKNAGGMSRLVAALLDSILITVLIAWLPALGALGGAKSYVGTYMITIILVSLYEVILIASPLKGTLGKSALGIKVVNSEGSKPNVGQSILRAIVKSLPFINLVSIVLILLGKRALHDAVAGTFTVRKNGGTQLSESAQEAAFTKQ